MRNSPQLVVSGRIELPTFAFQAGTLSLTGSESSLAFVPRGPDMDQQRTPLCGQLLRRAHHHGARRQDRSTGAIENGQHAQPDHRRPPIASPYAGCDSRHDWIIALPIRFLFP